MHALWAQMGGVGNWSGGGLIELYLIAKFQVDFG